MSKRSLHKQKYESLTVLAVVKAFFADKHLTSRKHWVVIELAASKRVEWGV